MLCNFSQNQFFRLELISSFSDSSKDSTMPSYLQRKYSKFVSNPTIIGCRAFDNSISYCLDLLFPTFDENKQFKIISHELEKVDIVSTNVSKVIYKKITENKNDLNYFLITVKFQINISLDPMKGNFVLLQSGEELYSLFINNHNLTLK